uniref:Uncharacterized protein n=1 Tax=Anguilla anguilla TaxID=7936 RepID=A0A0E9X833_ANGAN
MCLSTALPLCTDGYCPAPNKHFVFLFFFRSYISDVLGLWSQIHTLISARKKRIIFEDRISEEEIFYNLRKWFKIKREKSGNEKNLQKEKSPPDYKESFQNASFVLYSDPCRSL